MPLSATWSLDRLRKKAGKRGRGYPLATVAFYGPTASSATKVVVGVVAEAGAEVEPMERWHSPDQDVRKNPVVLKSVLQFIEAQGVKSVVMPSGLLGCPHEEGIDYPEGEPCPFCPYWRGRDRFTGLIGSSEDSGG